MAKKKHAHHGGAWKVAYADFVTAMMALFMVLWISAQDDEVLLATSDFFQNPFNSPMESGYGVMTGEGSGNSSSVSGKKSPSTLMDMAFLHTLASELYRMLKVEESESQKPIDIQVTSDGLRITVFNRGDRKIFQQGSTGFTQWGDLIVQNLSWIMDRHDMRVRIDSYTYEGVIPTTDEYSPWELTTDRGNIVRRALIHYALNPNKIDRVTGFGPSHPLLDHNSTDPSNDRIEFSLVVNQ